MRRFPARDRRWRCCSPEVWGSKTLRGRSAGLLRGWFVLGDEPSENGPAFDPLVGQISGWTVGSWRPKIEGPVRTSAVVVTGVFAKRSAEVLLAKDQHTVGDLAADGEHEPLRIRIGPSRRMHPMALMGTDLSG